MDEDLLEGLKVAVSAAMNAGINVNSADLTMGPQSINALPFTDKTYNFSAGRNAGWTSRYGIWPIPGHNSNENGTIIAAGAMSGYSMRNLVASEQVQAAHTTAGLDVYDRRRYLYGAAVVQLPVSSSEEFVPVIYWISSRLNASGDLQIDLLPSVEIVAGGQQMGIRSHLEAGVGGGGAVVSYVGGVSEVNRTLRAVDRLHTTALARLRKLPTDFRKYLRWTILQTAIETNIREFVGAQPAATPDPGGIPRDAYFGFPGNPYWNNGLSQKRNMGFDVSLSGSAGLVTAPKKWTAKGYFSDVAGDLTGVAATNRSQSPTASAAGGRLNFSLVSTATYATSGAYPGAGSTHLFCRVDDQPATVSLTLVAMVTDRPLIAVINPLLRDSTEADTTSTPAAPPPGGNDFVQWLDPTNNLWAPRLYNTKDATLAAAYTEQWGTVATAKQTCWQNAPVFVHGVNTANVGTSFGGLLQANTVYEYAYSIYNALTGKESNVGAPARVFVAANNSAIRLQQSMNPMMYGAQSANSQFPAFPEMFSEGNSDVQAAVPVNYLSYRLYYREVGSFEWLFNGEYSFSKVYFEPFAEALYIGRTSAVGAVGGQAGGYNDYSDLPVDEYIDVTEFQGFLMWLTKQTLRWSRSDNAFAYPVRNYAPAPSGEFRGFLTHFFAGQAQQNGRIVIFGSDAMYDARFTGNLIEEQVRVSATAPPQPIAIDGSDLQLSVRSSETAFSARCAVVAEGIVYFMGPNGIFRDDGVDLPRRVSQSIEPLYFDAYDKTSTDEFFAYYNKRSREILFFYRPSGINPDANPYNYATKAWVYSLRTEQWDSGVIGAWSQYGYNCVIDWAQNLDVTKFETVAHGPGLRTLIGARATTAGLVSRGYYHDDDCEGGDYRPGDEMMVKELQRPDASTVRFVLATGFSSTILNNIVVGSTDIAVKGSSSYGDMAVLANVDGFYKVKAKNLGAGTIDIEATGNLAAIPAQTFSVFKYFPIFVQGAHDVVCRLHTNYLAPEGIFRWIQARYAHLLIKPVPRFQGTATPFVAVEWSSNHEQATTTSSKNLPLYAINDRETTTQLVSDIPGDDMQAYGQAIKTTLTYNQVAGRWTLYFLAHYYEDRGPGELKYYQRTYG